MFNKILIANRGEIALRIIRACRELGVPSVAIYSEPDADSLHVQLADEAYCVGPAPAAQSYLNIHNIMSVACVSGADAIHPGYGFLAENATFADICAEHKVAFIGPSAKMINTMGDKASAKKAAQEAGLPVVPGTDGIVSDPDLIAAWGKAVGFPILLKATAGGGGKGMRIVEDESKVAEMLAMAQNEAKAAFGNPGMYAEKLIAKPRHIEFQILADKYGNVVHLGERDCSIQRRHQKLLEESPSPVVTPEIRERVGNQLLRAIRKLGYEGVGTVEFLFDNDLNAYFMEMNTRIQVEHPVTEMVTGIDLIQAQIRVAAGERLWLTQDDITLRGHAIECRINAEDPTKNFMPNPGTIDGYCPPGGFGIRVDSHVYSGYKIPPFYDSMIGKLICWGETRNAAIARMQRALHEYAITGVKTTIPFHQQVMQNAIFTEGKNIDTGFIAETALA
ncbi:MAG: acetyl-CoA carboxylase biotin carboxylase subunit [Vampirovibrionales bacterium]|nr:acetyl-CoA carboxylase biotin carboxylase subunit [Vampirovibrionales bacterium]